MINIKAGLFSFLDIPFCWRKMGEINIWKVSFIKLWEHDISAGITACILPYSFSSFISLAAEFFVCFFSHFLVFSYKKNDNNMTHAKKKDPHEGQRKIQNECFCYTFRNKLLFFSLFVHSILQKITWFPCQLRSEELLEKKLKHKKLYEKNLGEKEHCLGPLQQYTKILNRVEAQYLYCVLKRGRLPGFSS